jgi:hypothetical protein
MMNFIGMKPEATKASATPRELSAVARAIAQTRFLRWS